jgi:hypothetical protein
MMAFQQAELRFRELKAHYDNGELDEAAFRVEVAKLLLQDDQGVFWMLDADSGEWSCNRGRGWETRDPHAQRSAQTAAETGRERGWRLGRWWALGIALLCLLGLVGIVGLWLALPEGPSGRLPSTRDDEVYVQVMIASPIDGVQVPLGQAVAVESTIDALPSLNAVDRVVLRVDDQVVDTQSIQFQIQPGQTSFPLSQPWLPEVVGEYEIEVIAFSADNQPLASERVAVEVVEASEEVLPELSCMPDATFVADVTIPPGSAFPPGVRLDKVWQVRNSSSCAWGVGLELVRLEGEGLAAPSAVPVPPTAAGELTDLAVTLWAPMEAGVHTDVWQLRSPDGEFFGPTLTLAIDVEVLARESLPPATPVDLRATVAKDGQAVQLTWLDRSDDEDAFRIYRADLEASIGLAPADSELFVDEDVACGNTYQYSVVAFNAAGTSATSPLAAVALPPCGPTDAPPILSLTVVPTEVQVTEPFTVAFKADDDLGLEWVVVWGERTDDPALDSGQVFSCTQVVCTGTWPVSWTGEPSVTLSLVAVALDSSAQESEPVRTSVTILPLEWFTQTGVPEP